MKNFKKLRRYIISFKKFSLMSYLPMPSVIEQKGYYNVTANCAFILSIPQDRASQNDFKSYSIWITMNNYLEIRKVFAKAYSWFCDPNMKDLFMRVSEDDNSIIFNSKYAGLESTFKSQTQVLKIVPASIYDNSISQEGVIMYVNLNENSVLLTISELKLLASTFESIDFMSEFNLLISGFRLALDVENIEKQDYNSTSKQY